MSHPLCARLYVKQAEAAESRCLAVQRRRMLAGLAGQIAETGAGYGLNFAHYPASASMVHAFEPERTICALWPCDFQFDSTVDKAIKIASTIDEHPASRCFTWSRDRSPPDIS